MRIRFPDLVRPKAAAKYLARLSPELKLSAAQEALAQALGYRDWHELSVSARRKVSAEPANATTGEVVRIVADFAEALSLSNGDVQYAVSKARLLRESPWSLNDQLGLRSAIWRQRVFGPRGRGKPGTVVKVRANGSTRVAYLRLAGRPSHVVYDTGPGTCGDFEVVTPRTPVPDFVPSRLWLPYGYWTLRDGSEIIFSRDYLPIWRVAAGQVERLDPWLWINGITAEFNFGTSLGTAVWSKGPACELALRYLNDRRVFELPKLVDILPHLLEPDVESIAKGVERLREGRGGTGPPPSYARRNEHLAHG